LLLLPLLLLLPPPAALPAREALTDAVMEAASSESVDGLAKASMGTPEKVSAPATACVPGEADAEGAVEGCRGTEEGEAPAAPQTASATRVHADVSTGSAPEQVEQLLQTAAPLALAKEVPRTQGAQLLEPAAAAEPGPQVVQSAAPIAAAEPAPHMVHASGPPPAARTQPALQPHTASDTAVQAVTMT
jgi:hypothetical protein